MADEKIPPSPKWVRTRKEIPELYGNFFHSTWTLFDVRVRVGELIPDPSGELAFLIDERAAVTFSWPQAKILAQTLSLLVDSFEKTNGEIKPLKLPPDPTIDNK